MQKNIKKIVSMLLVISMLLGIFPMTIFAVEDTRTLITEIRGTISGDETIDDFAPVYGESTIADANIPVIIEDPLYHPAYFYNLASCWEKKVAGEWEEQYVDTFTSGTYRLRISVYVDNDNDNPEGCKTGADTHRLDVEGNFKVYINDEEWTNTEVCINGTSIGAATIINVYSKEFEVEEPAELTFPDRKDYDIKYDYINNAIKTFSVANYTEGGTKPYTYSKVSGPSWINVSGDGTVSGTRNALAGDTTLTIRVTDAASTYKDIEIAVGATHIQPENREVISEIKGTIADEKTIDDFKPIYGENVMANRPVVNEDSTYHPAYFYSKGLLV